MTTPTSRVACKVLLDGNFHQVCNNLTYLTYFLKGRGQFKPVSDSKNELVISDSSSNEDTSAPTHSTARQSESQTEAAATITIKDALDMLKYSFILQVRMIFDHKNSWVTFCPDQAIFFRLHKKYNMAGQTQRGIKKQAWSRQQ